MTTIYQERLLPAPIVDSATQPYWAAAREGVFKTRRCTKCERVHWYPRPVCPFCMGDTQWMDCTGFGAVYSITVTRRAGPVPYAIAYVTLDEGVTLLTNIVDCDLDAVRIGDRVRLVFKSAEDGQPVPMFTPA